MSKEMTPAELIAHITDAADDVKRLLQDFASSSRHDFQKRAMLLGYWLKTYTKYLRRKDFFDPHSVPNYKRGSIIQVDFGYRIGSELGGLHYAVVMNNLSHYNADVLLVVPLSSLHGRTTLSRYQIHLEDGVYATLNQKATGLLQQANILLSDAVELKKGFDYIENRDELTILQSTYASKLRSAKILFDSATEVLDGITHLKDGSIALVGQTTTISKMRIKRPLKKTDILYGTRLSARDMDAINNALKELYIFK